MKMAKLITGLCLGSMLLAGCAQNEESEAAKREAEAVAVENEALQKKLEQQSIKAEAEKKAFLEADEVGRKLLAAIIDGDDERARALVEDNIKVEDGLLLFDGYEFDLKTYESPDESLIMTTYGYELQDNGEVSIRYMFPTSGQTIGFDFSKAKNEDTYKVTYLSDGH